MAVKVLKEAVVESKNVEYIVKAALPGRTCDMCETTYVVRTTEWQNFRLTGIFDKVSTNYGNTFDIQVCSFGCAHQAYTGGWRKLPSFRDRARHGFEMLRAELRIERLCSPEEAQARWEDSPDGRIDLTCFQNTSIGVATSC